MSLSVKCPTCGAGYSVVKEKLGARAKCKCGHTFTLTMSTDDTLADRKEPASANGTKGRSLSDESALASRTELGTAGRAGEPARPNQIGQYQVKRKLGAGAMGEVYLAHDPKLQRDVAIKVLPEECSKGKERLQRFLREARSAARLHHTNAAAVYEIGTEGRLTFIAMEYVDGSPLDEAIADSGPMNWREATQIIRDAASGLAAAHEIGLVHRDVKPSNLMLNSKGVTKVVDFGLARTQVSQTELTRAGTLLGTPAYMAPEQWVAGDIDGRSDLYSLTVTYYALLTGRPPFADADLPALGYLHRYEPLPDPRQHVPDLADGVCRILARGSAKEPAERYQTGEELIADLDTLLATPDDSLTTASAWQELTGGSVAAHTGRQQRETPDTKPSASVEPEPVTKPRALLSPTARSIVSLTAGWFRARRVSSRRRTVQLCFASGAAVLLFASIYMTGNHGTARITVSLPPKQTVLKRPWGSETRERSWGFETVTVEVDGDALVLQEGGGPVTLTLSAGEHELDAYGSYINPVRRTFNIQRGDTTDVRVSLEADPGPDTLPDSDVDPDSSGMDDGPAPLPAPAPSIEGTPSVKKVVAPQVDESLENPFGSK